MTGVQKPLVAAWTLAVSVLLVLLFLRGKIGIFLWTLLVNPLLMYGTFRDWNSGKMRRNGREFLRRENPSLFTAVFWGSLLLMLILAIGPGIVIIAGWVP